MKIAFFAERGTTPEIGTGHFYRCKWTSEEMSRRGFDTVWVKNAKDIINSRPNALVIDDLRSQYDLIAAAKNSTSKIILIDGIKEDTGYVDLSISAFYNSSAKFRGIDYMSFLPKGNIKHSPDNSKIFVGMGGFDANNIGHMVISRMAKIHTVSAIIAKSINYVGDNKLNVPDKYELFHGDNYYEKMKECGIAITNGGLTMFQALHMGLPTIAIPQYEHQRLYIDAVKDACVLTEPSEAAIDKSLAVLLKDSFMREQLSFRAKNLIDGKGISRTCDLIEGILE